NFRLLAPLNPMAPSAGDDEQKKPPQIRRRRARSTEQRITELDRELLAFATVHRFIRLDHVARLLGSSHDRARAQVRALTEMELLTQDRTAPGPLPCWQITRAGTRLIGSRLRPPARGHHDFVHEVGVDWLWLAIREGRFGAMNEVITARELRARDRAGHRADPPLAVRLGGPGRHGLERLHYPDLLLVTAGGQRVAVELELT